MKTIYSAIGGRMTKWKGKVVSFAPYVSSSIAMGVAASAIFFGSAAQAQDVSYVDGAAPTVIAADQITSIYQLGTADIQALIMGGAVTSTSVGSTGAMSTSLLSNAITATGVGNNAATSLDLSLATGAGTTSNAVVVSALENAANNAFARISGSSITSTVSALADDTLIVSGNTIGTSVTLAKSVNMLEGDIATSFANTDAGTLSVTATDYTAASGPTALSYGDTTAASNAGLLLQSTQLNASVQNATSGVGGFDAFSVVATSDINLSASSGASASLLSLDGNSISAAFTGASAANTLYVEDGGISTLSSAAGISNVQVAESVGTSGTTELENAVIALTSGIDATITGALTTTSVDLTQNSMATSAAQNTATNTMYLADGISVDASGTLRSYAVDNIDLSSGFSAAAVTADINNADLFVSNVQSSIDSSIIAQTNGADGITMSAAGSATGVSISATSNAVTATTTGNKNTGNLVVAGANVLDAVVAQTNVQSFVDATTDNLGNTATADITDPLMSLTVASDGSTTVGSAATISLSSNAVTASSIANSGTMATSLSGNSLTDGVVAGTEVAPSAETDNTSNAIVTAGFSAVNSQTVTGDADADSSSYVVQSKITDTVSDTLGLTVGSAGSTVVGSLTAGTILTNSALDMSSNAITSTAKANTGTQSLAVSANDLTASVAVVGQQSLQGGVLASITGTTLAMAAVADGVTTDVADLTMTAESNAVTSSAIGNTASNSLSASATTLTAIETVVAIDLTTARTAMSLDGFANDANAASAGLTVLNSQYSTTAKSADAIASTITDAGISVALTPDAQTAGSTVTNLTMALDSNTIGSTARANLASNSMTLDFGSLSLAMAARDSNAASSAVGGTNIAVLGSSQVNTIGVTSTVDAGSTASDLIASIATGTGDIDTSSLSASSNAITSLASGNAVTNTFALTGTAIETPDANAPDTELTVASTVTSSTAITATNTAFAVGNEQANSGAVTSTIGAGTGTNYIGATALGARDLIDSTIAADSNIVVAQAVAASDATTTSTIDATSIATSFLAASRQLNTGAVQATVGASSSGLTIQATTSTTGTIDNSSITASSNTIGATATAVSDVLSLTLGGPTTATLDGSGIVGAAYPYLTATATTTAAIADFAQIESQTNSGNVTATTTDASVKTQAGTTTDSTVESNSNLLTAIASGISGTTTMTGTAASIGGTAAPTFALGSSQNTTGNVTGTLNSADVAMIVQDTGATTDSESLSMDVNTLSASATGAKGSNTLTTTATGAIGGLQDVGELTTTKASSSASISADRALVSDQANSGDVTAELGTDAKITMTLNAATAGSLLSVASNTLAGTATGLSGTNALNSNAGAENAASVGLVSSQVGSGDILADIDVSTISVTLISTVSSSAVDIASNTVAAAATGLTGTNTVSITGGSIAPLSGTAIGASTSTASALPDVDRTFAALVSYQAQSDSVSATVNDNDTGTPTTLKLAITGATADSALSLTSNSIAATATAGTATNTLSQISTTSIDFANNGSALASVQSGTINADVTSTIESVSFAMTGAGIADSTVTMTGNAATASATGFSATNANTLTAGTAITGDDIETAGTLTVGVLTGTALTSALSNTQTNLGDVTATMTTAGTDAAAPQVSVDVTAMTGNSTIDVSSNTMRAQASGLLAVNSNTLSAASMTDFSAVTANYQSQTGIILANLASPQFTISATSAAGSLATDANIGVASATGTSATNTLTLTADTSISGTAAALAPKTVNMSTTTLSAADTTSLLNSQSGSADVTASINDDNGVGDVLIGSTLTGALTGSISADSNVLVSQARGNIGVSTYSLTAGTSVDSATQGLLASQQTRSGGDLLSEITSSGAGAYGEIGVTVGSSVTGSVSVSDNTVRATGTANIALNSMSITAGSEIEQLAASAATAATGAGVMTTNAQYAVINGQNNASDATSTLTNFIIGVDANSATNGSLALNGNLIMADATGNNAANSLTLTSAGYSTDASASVSNYQANSGDMSAAISGASVVMATSATNGSISVANNTISASAIGNTATSTINTNGSSFKSF